MRLSGGIAILGEGGEGREDEAQERPDQSPEHHEPSGAENESTEPAPAVGVPC